MFSGGKLKHQVIRDVPDIRFRLAGYPAIFSYPVPVPAKMVPGTGYLSRIVVGPFWQWDVLKNAVCLLEPFEEATKICICIWICMYRMLQSAYLTQSLFLLD